MIELYRELKQKTGSHSPSLFELKRNFPDLQIEVDACFLSNPYATELFLSELDRDLTLNKKKIRDILEFYPSQNQTLAIQIAKFAGVTENNVFVCNGATEGIKAIFDNLITKGTLLLPIPTFSPYYEFASSEIKVSHLNLNKEENYLFNTNSILEAVQNSQANHLCLISPNNPNGTFLPYPDLISLISKLTHLDTIILDESFSHFALKDDELDQNIYYKLIHDFPNLVIVKSMSKDFGIAGIRAGYLISSEKNIELINPKNFLWNINGFGEYFFDLYLNPEFQKLYRKERLRYNNELQKFSTELSQLEGIKVYPGNANFFLVEILNGKTADDIFFELLFHHGVYVRTCYDKIGLSGEFLRIACRSEVENELIIRALQKVLSH